MKNLKIFTFVAKCLFVLSFVACSEQRPVIEKTEILPPPKSINETEAQNLLSRSQNLNQTSFEIRQNYSSDFNWVKFWNTLPQEMNIEKLETSGLISILRLGSIQCSQRELDEFGKFSFKMAKQDNERSYEYLKNLQVAHYACQKDLNSFQLRQSLSLYRDVIKQNLANEEKLRGLESNFVEYLRFLNKLAQINLDFSEIEILLNIKIDQVIEPLQKENQIDALMHMFTALKGLAPFQRQLWEKPLKVLLQNEEKIVNSLKGLSLSELISILEQVKELIAKNYADQTKLEINDLLIKKFSDELTKKRPSELDDINLYVARIVQESGRLYYLQKSIFKKDIKGFLTANDASNYELGLAVKGFSNAFLQENALRINNTPYFLYLDHYIRRIEFSSFQPVFAEYGDEIDQFDSYFNLRNTLDFETEEMKRDENFDKLCELVGVADFDKDAKRPLPGCYKLEEISINKSSYDIKINDHAYFKAYDKKVDYKVKSISGGVFNLSSKQIHPAQQQVPADSSNDAIVFPLMIGFKYTGDNETSVCFQNGNTYYLPYQYVYQSAKPGYLPELFKKAEVGFDGGLMNVEVKQSSHNIRPEIISLASAGQIGAKGMKPGNGRRIRFKEEDMAFRFVQMMEGETNQYVLQSCRSVDSLLTLIKNSEKGQFNGSSANKVYIDLAYLNFLSASDQTRFEDDMLIFQQQAAPFCTDENCLIEELGQKAATLMSQQLIKAQVDGAQVTDILNENQTKYHAEKNNEFGENQKNGERGKNGKLDFKLN